MKRITILSIIFIIIVITTCVFINLHDKQEESTTVTTKESGDNVADSIIYLINTDEYKKSSSNKKEEMLGDVLEEFITSEKIKSYKIILDKEAPQVLYTDKDDIERLILLQPFKKNQN